MAVLAAAVLAAVAGSTAPSCPAALRPGVCFYGSNDTFLRLTNLSSDAECCSACQARRPRCRFFSMNRPDLHCNLKATLTSPPKAGNCSSGTMPPANCSGWLLTVQQRVLDNLLPSTPAEQREAVRVARLLNASLQQNGTWADIDYADASRAHWPLLFHLVRAVVLWLLCDLCHAKFMQTRVAHCARPFTRWMPINAVTTQS